MNKFLGAVMILMALTMAIAPVFSDCQSQGKALTLENGRTVPMKCHWAGIAAIGAAVPLGLAGVFALRGGRKETMRQASLIGVASGALGILFPTLLIGVCGNPTMICNMVMRPILIAAGTVAIAASIALFVLAREAALPAVEVAA
jgi:predicted cobalt transporter CbtA